MTLALDLAGLGFSTTQIGLLIGVGLAGSSLATVIVSLRGDAWGRRRVLVGLALLSATGYLALAVFTDAASLVPLAFIGMLNGMGRDCGAASALDQAILPCAGPNLLLTWVQTGTTSCWREDMRSARCATTISTVLMRATTLELDAAHRLTFLACAGAAPICIFPYLKLTPHIEAAVSAKSDRRRAAGCPEKTRHYAAGPVVRSGQHRRRVPELRTHRLLVLSAIRNVRSRSRALVLCGPGAERTFASRGGRLARRIGLLNTMVWTHLPSSLFLIAAPASPTAAIAGALFLAREALVEMDVPTRQLYVMAVVKPSERTLASGVTNVTRNVGWAVGPSVAGVVMQHVALAGPLVIGGVLKIGYDLLLYRAFRHVRPPEEEIAAHPQRVRSGV